MGQTCVWLERNFQKLQTVSMHEIGVLDLLFLDSLGPSTNQSLTPTGHNWRETQNNLETGQQFKGTHGTQSTIRWVSTTNLSFCMNCPDFCPRGTFFTDFCTAGFPPFLCNAHFIWSSSTATTTQKVLIKGWGTKFISQGTKRLGPLLAHLTAMHCRNLHAAPSLLFPYGQNLLS